MLFYCGCFGDAIGVVGGGVVGIVDVDAGVDAGVVGGFVGVIGVFSLLVLLLVWCYCGAAVVVLLLIIIAVAAVVDAVVDTDVAVVAVVCWMLLITVVPQRVSVGHQTLVANSQFG